MQWVEFVDKLSRYHGKENSLPCPVYAKEKKYWQFKKSMIPSKPMDLSALQLFMKMQLKN